MMKPLEYFQVATFSCTEESITVAAFDFFWGVRKLSMEPLEYF